MPVPSLETTLADSPHWYVLRTTYGQEKKAYDYLSARQVEVFLPTEKVCRVIHDKRKLVDRSLLPNILFAHGTEEQLKTFVYDNVNLPFLRFYYRYLHTDGCLQKEPLIVPDAQMSTFRIICEARSADAIVARRAIPRFQRGELARVVEGKFRGVVGRVVRYKAQQRVGIVIDGLLTVATAYIPDAFLERVTENAGTDNR